MLWTACTTIGRTMNTAAFRSRLGVLGLSVRSFAAMTGVHYETARHWGGSRSGNSPGVSALGAADARNDGPDCISEAARRRGETATAQIRRHEARSRLAIIIWQQHPDISGSDWPKLNFGTMHSSWPRERKASLVLSGRPSYIWPFGTFRQDSSGPRHGRIRHLR